MRSPEIGIRAVSPASLVRSVAPARFAVRTADPSVSRVTRITHGTRNTAAKNARDSATMAVPNTGTETRMKMYCSDHSVASSSHRAPAELVTL